MAGHSHAANVKHRKNSVDAKRAKIFSKLARHIISAAKQGGAELDTNLKLKYAVEKARAANMPKDNIERAIKRGTGDKDGDDFEDLLYEGYAPGGVALLVSCLTDNRKRTAPEVKYTFDHCAGNMGTTGSVSFMFDFVSVFVVELGELSEEQMMEVALEAGADDLVVEEDVGTIYAPAPDFLEVKDALDAKGLTILSAETGYVPKNTVAVESKEDARKILKLIETLEENEDVQNVYANYDMPSEWIDELQA